MKKIVALAQDRGEKLRKVSLPTLTLPFDLIRMGYYFASNHGGR